MQCVDGAALVRAYLTYVKRKRGRGSIDTGCRQWGRRPQHDRSPTAANPRRGAGGTGYHPAADPPRVRVRAWSTPAPQGPSKNRAADEATHRVAQAMYRSSSEQGAQFADRVRGVTQPGAILEQGQAAWGGPSRDPRLLPDQGDLKNDRFLGVMGVASASLPEPAVDLFVRRIPGSLASQSDRGQFEIPAGRCHQSDTRERHHERAVGERGISSPSNASTPAAGLSVMNGTIPARVWVQIEDQIRIRRSRPRQRGSSKPGHTRGMLLRREP